MEGSVIAEAQRPYTVCILGPRGLPVGTGILVGQRDHIITCAHVVAMAQGRASKTDEPELGVSITCQLSLLGGAPFHAETLHVWPWRDDARADELADIAILKVPEPSSLPSGAVSAVLMAEATVSEVIAYGYPKSGDSVGVLCGSSVTLQVLAPNDAGHCELHQPGMNKKIEPGYSGGPALHRDGRVWPVIGMVHSMDRQRAGLWQGGLRETLGALRRTIAPCTAYMIPARNLRRALAAKGIALADEPPEVVVQAADPKRQGVIAALIGLFEQPLSRSSWTEVIDQVVSEDHEPPASVPMPSDPAGLACWLLEDLPGLPARRPRMIERLTAASSSAEIRARGAALKASLCEFYGIDTAEVDEALATEHTTTALVLELTPRQDAPPTLTVWRFTRKPGAGADAPEQLRQHPLTATDEDGQPVDNLLDHPHVLARAVHRMLDRLPRDEIQRPQLELVLPPELMTRWEYAPETWRHRDAYALGCQYPMVFRSPTGFAGANGARRHWRRVRDAEAVVGAAGAEALAPALAVCNGATGALESFQEDGRGVVFGRVPPDLPGAPEVNHLGYAIDAGISLALWPKRWAQDSCFGAKLARVLGCCRVRELPERLRRLRAELRRGHGDDIARCIEEPMFRVGLLLDDLDRCRKPFRRRVPL